MIGLVTSIQTADGELWNHVMRPVISLYCTLPTGTCLPYTATTAGKTYSDWKKLLARCSRPRCWWHRCRVLIRFSSSPNCSCDGLGTNYFCGIVNSRTQTQKEQCCGPMSWYSVLINWYPLRQSPLKNPRQLESLTRLIIKRRNFSKPHW